MKKSKILCLVTVALLAVYIAVPAVAQPEGPVNSCIGLQADKPLAGNEKLLDSAKAVILYELNSKTMVYSYHPDVKLDPSGMNKIMTAMIALEQGDPQAVVTVTRKALDSVPIGSVSANLKRYEEIKLIDLLYCMMVGSANDAAAVIAEHVGGSQETFVAMMNLRATELGCKNTYFMNANGIRVEGQYTTARDLATITAAALQNETFAKMFSTVNYTVAQTNKAKARELISSNNMMVDFRKDHYDPRVTGGKTGALSTTDRSLICTAEQNGGRYLSVVMSATGTVSEDGFEATSFGSFEETKKLLDFAFEQYGVVSLLQADQVVDRFTVSGAENLISACPKNALRVALPALALPSDVQYQTSMLPNLQMPISAGQQIGSVQVWYNGICIGQSDLVAMHDVYAPGTHHTLVQPTVREGIQRNWTSVLLIGGAVVLFLLAAGGIVLLVFRVRAMQRHSRLVKHREKQRSA